MLLREYRIRVFTGRCRGLRSTVVLRSKTANREIYGDKVFSSVVGFYENIYYSGQIDSLKCRLLCYFWTYYNEQFDRYMHLILRTELSNSDQTGFYREKIFSCSRKHYNKNFFKKHTLCVYR